MLRERRLQLYGCMIGSDGDTIGHARLHPGVRASCRRSGADLPPHSVALGATERMRGHHGSARMKQARKMKAKAKAEAKTPGVWRRWALAAVLVAAVGGVVRRFGE